MGDRMIQVNILGEQKKEYPYGTTYEKLHRNIRVSMNIPSFYFRKIISFVSS